MMKYNIYTVTGVLDRLLKREMLKASGYIE